MVKELGYEGIINYWYSIPGGHFDGALVKLSEDADVLDMLTFVPYTRLINIFLEHVLACNQEQFYSQVDSNIFINLDDDFGTNTRVVIEELDDNYGAIVPMGGGVSQVGKVKKSSVVIEELNQEGLNQEGFNEQAGGQGKELNEEGLTDEASRKGKEKATVNTTVNNEGYFDKSEGKDKVMDDMSHMVKCAFGKKRCKGLMRTNNVQQKDKEAVEGTVEGIRAKSKSHSMKLRSGRRYANVADFDSFDDDSTDSEESNYVISKNFSEDEDEDEDDDSFEKWVDD
ncbi:uncharacterized protein Pyn_11374 [Prunus yedoensis var. nudiflora]|uniref:Uncharacterized protein n=1 Tax=Prunus yedoensis var. nudiflora TaxID=2094558 RepID=A0A315A200_PRUYE|nr:uncharacterized protein Pyn_11374 [Prunus yedoensis var. nudiflora]